MRLLRTTALIAVLVGAAGTVVLFFRASEHTPPLLVVLFMIWLLSPFVILGWANVISKRWSVLTQAALYCVTLVIALASLAIYGNVIVITRHGAPKAAPFVVVAPASFLLTAIVVSIAARVSSRQRLP